MRREGEGWSFYRGIPRSPGGGDRPPLSPAGGATGPLPPVGWAQRPVARGLGPAAGRPWAGRQAPVAPPMGDRAFFSRDLIANLKKKIYT